jgi:glycosyltransferase involved in cell wall biosynthesis
LRWLVVEPYADGSHRRLLDGLGARFADRLTVWTLPARKWKWRLRGSSLEFARRFAVERPEVDAILASSMCNLAELRALLPPAARALPALLYFHENQLAYPIRHPDRRDHHFAFTQLHAALCAERVLFNSQYNRDSFVDGVRALARKMPDFRPHWAAAAVAARSDVLPVPLPLQGLLHGARTARRGGPPHIVWNHRWEYDKGPALLLDVVRRLCERDLSFELSLLGQSFADLPPQLDALRELCGPRLLRFGFVPDRSEYERILLSADIALSTAQQEFQGLSVIEAAAAGAVPLVPDALAYREIWPAAWRSAEGELASALCARVESGPATSSESEAARRIAARFDWNACAAKWERELSQAPALQP